MKREYEDKSITCIAKSIDLRPSMVFIEEKVGAMVSVKPVDGVYDKPLFVPIRQIFEWNDDLFPKLKSAYESHNGQTLERLWRLARPMRGDS